MILRQYQQEAERILSLWEKMERLGRDVRRLRDARSEFSQAAGVFPKAQK